MSNSNLVFLSNDKTVPLTTTKIIADSLGYRANDVLNLCEKYLTDLEEFGHVPFQTVRNELKNNVVLDAKVACLNEQQATLLVCYMRNSEKVRRFKVALVKAFYEMRTAIEKARLAGERPAALMSATKEQEMHFEKEKRATEYAQMHDECAGYMEWVAGKENEMSATATDLQAAMTLAESVMKRAASLLNLIAERKAITRSKLIRKMRECEKAEKAIAKREHLKAHKCFRFD